MELRNFTGKGQQDLSYLRAHPPAPSAGFNVTFEDLTLDTAAGAPLIFARLTAVTTKLFKARPKSSQVITPQIS